MAENEDIEKNKDEELEEGVEDKSKDESKDKSDKEAGLVKDLSEERGKRHEAEAEVVRLRAEAESKKEPKPEIKDPLEGMAEDEPVTAGEIRKSREAEEAKRKADQVEAQKNLADRSYFVARQELTADKTGEGLDLDTVMHEGAKNLSPKDQQTILNAGEKCMQKMYELCIERTPALRERKLKHDSQAEDETDKDKDKDKGKSGKKKPKEDEEEPLKIEDEGEHTELLKFFFEDNSTEEE